MAVALVVFVTLWALAIVALWAYSWVRLGGIDLRALDDEGTTLGVAGAAAPAGATTVLVVLTDMNDPTRPRPSDLAAPVALVQAGGPRAEVAVLLLPVEVPVSVDGRGVLPLSELQRSDGTDALAQAIIDYTEVRVDHVVTLTREALPRLVEALGPVEACLPAGCGEVTPERMRAALADADPQVAVRTAVDVLGELAAGFDLRRAILRPLAVKRTVDVLATEVDTDVSLRGLGLLRMAELLAGGATVEVDTLPILRHPATGDIVPVAEPAAVRFQALRDGTPLPRVDDRQELTELAIGVARVAVLNGVGSAGLAARVGSQLQDEGFRVVGTGNAPTTGHETTVVAYVAGDPLVEASVILLAEALGGAQLQARSGPLRFQGEEIDAEVIVGADLDGATSSGANLGAGAAP